MPADVIRAIAEIDRITARDRVLIRAFRGEEADVTETPDKAAALVDAVRVLTDMGVAHALIGGVAVGIRSGSPRATLDTDLAVMSTVDHADLRSAFLAAGFRLVGEFPHSINFRHRSGEPLQLAFDPGFDPMIARAERLSFAGLAVPIVTLSDLISMKERAAADPARRPSKRLRDQADVALLRGDVPDPDEGW